MHCLLALSIDSMRKHFHRLEFRAVKDNPVLHEQLPHLGLLIAIPMREVDRPCTVCGICNSITKMDSTDVTIASTIPHGNILPFLEKLATLMLINPSKVSTTPLDPTVVPSVRFWRRVQLRDSSTICTTGHDHLQHRREIRAVRNVCARGLVSFLQQRDSASLKMHSHNFGPEFQKRPTPREQSRIGSRLRPDGKNYLELTSGSRLE
jgi:hypothetical protein